MSVHKVSWLISLQKFPPYSSPLILAGAGDLGGVAVAAAAVTSDVACSTAAAGTAAAAAAHNAAHSVSQLVAAAAALDLDLAMFAAVAAGCG